MAASSPDPFLLSADALLPMDPALPPVLHQAGIVISGDRILGVGPLDALRTAYGTLPAHHHPGVLLPGLINAHTHLELSYVSAANLPHASFPQWVSALLASQPPADQLECVVRQAIQKGIAQSLHAGVTTLGDISRHCRITRDELAHLPRPPRVVSFGEVVGLGQMRHRAPEMLDAATLPNSQFPIPNSLLPGISPHAPYTVEGPTLRACVRRAIIKHLPLCMHLAELPDEAAFLADLSGPLGRDWPLMQNLLDGHIPLYPGGPIRWAELHGLFICDPQNPPPRDLPVLLAHVNYIDHAEMMQLAASRASVAYCPRTHAYFRHAPHRYREMLDCGINVCLATDSLASNPDLSVLHEAQLLHERDQLDPLVALELITRRGAQALGLDRHLGTLSPTKYADAIILPVQTTPLDTPPEIFHRILTIAPPPTAVWIGGQACQ